MQPQRLKNVFQDLSQGLYSWRIWALLGWQDIRLRYRRSILGPIWITLSMAVMIYSMGFLYAGLFKVDLTLYFPYLAAGLVTWAFISSVINEGADALFNASTFIQQIKLPFSVYVLRMLTRNQIVFLHNMLAIIPIFFYFHVSITPLMLVLFVVNLIILTLCGFCYGYILALLGARFQDFKQIVTSVVQIFFLLTPIIWMPDMLPARFSFLADYNPFYQLVNLLRQPLIGQIPSLFTYGYISVLFVLGLGAMVLLLFRARHRIAFWL